MPVPIYDSIQAWKLRAGCQEDRFVQFFILYMCLDAWISSQTRVDSDRKKINWLKKDENRLRIYWEQIGFDKPSLADALDDMLDIRLVDNMSPIFRIRHPNATLTRKSDFKELIEFIYLVRCNLFHGDKNPWHFRDQRLVDDGAVILEDWITWILSTR